MVRHDDRRAVVRRRSVGGDEHQERRQHQHRGDQRHADHQRGEQPVGGEQRHRGEGEDAEAERRRDGRSDQRRTGAFPRRPGGGETIAGAGELLPVAGDEVDGEVDADADRHGGDGGRHEVDGVAGDLHEAVEPGDDHEDRHDAGEAVAQAAEERGADDETEHDGDRERHEQGVARRLQRGLPDEGRARDLHEAALEGDAQVGCVGLEELPGGGNRLLRARIRHLELDDRGACLAVVAGAGEGGGGPHGVGRHGEPFGVERNARLRADGEHGLHLFCGVGNPVGVGVGDRHAAQLFDLAERDRRGEDIVEHAQHAGLDEDAVGASAQHRRVGGGDRVDRVGDGRECRRIREIGLDVELRGLSTPGPDVGVDGVEALHEVGVGGEEVLDVELRRHLDRLGGGQHGEHDRRRQHEPGTSGDGGGEAAEHRSDLVGGVGDRRRADPLALTAAMHEERHHEDAEHGDGADGDADRRLDEDEKQHRGHDHHAGSEAACEAQDRRAATGGRGGHGVLDEGQEEGGDEAEQQVRRDEGDGRAEAELRDRLDAGDEVGQERHGVRGERQQKGPGDRGQAGGERRTGDPALGPLLPVATDGVEGEVDTERDHGDRHDEREDEIVLQADQIRDALEPDEQGEQERTDHGERPVGPEHEADDDQDGEDREADERAGNGALFLRGEVDVDGDAVDRETLGRAEHGLHVPVEFLDLGAPAEGDAHVAEAERIVVMQHLDGGRRHDPATVDLLALDRQAEALGVDPDALDHPVGGAVDLGGRGGAGGERPVEFGVDQGGDGRDAVDVGLERRVVVAEEGLAEHRIGAEDLLGGEQRAEVLGREEVAVVGDGDEEGRVDRGDEEVVDPIPCGEHVAAGFGRGRLGRCHRHRRHGERQRGQDHGGDHDPRSFERALKQGVHGQAPSGGMPVVRGGVGGVRGGARSGGRHVGGSPEPERGADVCQEFERARPAELVHVLGERGDAVDPGEDLEGDEARVSRIPDLVQDALHDRHEDVEGRVIGGVRCGVIVGAAVVVAVDRDVVGEHDLVTTRVLLGEGQIGATGGEHGVEGIRDGGRRRHDRLEVVPAPRDGFDDHLLVSVEVPVDRGGGDADLPGDGPKGELVGGTMTGHELDGGVEQIGAELRSLAVAILSAFGGRHGMHGARTGGHVFTIVAM